MIIFKFWSHLSLYRFSVVTINIVITSPIQDESYSHSSSLSRTMRPPRNIDHLYNLVLFF